ncbi:MAG: response regulator, partial [Anaerolineae bacterium]|nr:response regulator [Anaerolineae bacterium]
QNRNILAVHYSPDIGAIHADLTKVRQILFNLLSNACKFTSDGAITLTATRQAIAGQEWLTFSISDTGIGMSSAEVDNLFKAFVQADSSTTRRYGGTGLGLAITQRFVQMLGGRIEVESDLNVGTTFTIQIPTAVGKEKLEPALPQLQTARSSIANTILIIDDDPNIHNIMMHHLTEKNFRVVPASGGVEGLRLARVLRPKVIILDILMPEMDGWTVLTNLKADPDLADIPVIIVSILEDKNMGYTLGAVDYLTKPVDQQRLLATVQKYHNGTAFAQALVVEDNVETCDMLRRMLEKEGWGVTVAHHGGAGLEAVAANCPDLILLDLMMPGVDGFEFVAELRQVEKWRSIPVVVITAKDLTQAERHRLNNSVARVLQKGAYSRETLLSEIRSLVSGRVA